MILQKIKVYTYTTPKAIQCCVQYDDVTYMCVFIHTHKRYAQIVVDRCKLFMFSKSYFILGFNKHTVEMLGAFQIQHFYCCHYYCLICLWYFVVLHLVCIFFFLMLVNSLRDANSSCLILMFVHFIPPN